MGSDTPIHRAGFVTQPKPRRKGDSVAATTKTVGLHFIIDVEVEADSESMAIFQASPEAKRIEDQLNKLGYTAKLDEIRTRRPGSSEKAKEREARRKRERAG
jgi:hypothetical protein